jgi:hypothetical protein
LVPVRRGFTISFMALALMLAAAPAAGWSLSKDLVRPSLLAARDEVRKCAAEHALADGRYVVWIRVGEAGRAGVEVREAPAELEPDARRCITRAFARRKYPTPIAATVAWSAASPPQRSYSIGYPFVLALGTYGYDAGSDPPARIRPKPARSRRISRLAR